MPENYERRLTDDEIAKWGYIEEHITELALVRVEHDGRPRTVLAAVFPIASPDEKFFGHDVRPLALLIDDDLMGKLNPGPEIEDMRTDITDAALSKMLFDAREQIEMWADSVRRRSGRDPQKVRELITQIDNYRTTRGWNQHGFGGEDD